MRMSSRNSFSSNNIKMFESRKKTLQVSRNTKCTSSLSTPSVSNNYPKKLNQPGNINIAVPEAKQSAMKFHVSMKKSKRRLDAGALDVSSLKVSTEMDKLTQSQARVKEWLNRITCSKGRLKINSLANISGHERKTNNLEKDTYFEAMDSVSNTSTNFYSSLIQDNKSNNSLEDTKILKKLKTRKASIQPSLGESTSESSTKNVLYNALKNEKSLEGNKEKEEIKKTALPNIKPKYKPFLPVRSDQKKLSSKLFLGSLLPPGEKELADLRKWKLKKSKQF